MSTDILLAPTVKILSANTVLVENSPQVQSRSLSETELNAYFRSGAFTVEQALNPLIAAAAPLFALATKAGILSVQQSPESLEARITHELYTFECQARILNFRTQTILAARYALCALLDELIHHSPWGQKNEWSANRLLHAFYSEQADSEQFYSILQRANADPGQHQELLEFYYLCLSLGYYGKYRQTPETQAQHQSIMDQLYQNLRRCRSETSRSLGINAGQKILDTVPKKGIQHPFTLIATVGLVLISLSVSYAYISLKKTTASLSQSLSVLSQKPTPSNTLHLPVH